jgi:hypothetical protein
MEKGDHLDEGGVDGRMMFNWILNSLEDTNWLNLN